MVVQVVGLLLWFAGGRQWLKPWLEPLYKILYKPRAVPRLVNLAQLANIIQCLDEKMVVGQLVRSCDVCIGWRLHSVNYCVVTSVPLRADSTRQEWTSKSSLL